MSDRTPAGRSARVQRATGDADLRSPGAVLLVSTYELGHQPHGITLPKAFLERAGFEPSTMDLAVDEFDAAKVERARFVAVSVPMHTALRLGEGVARRIRRLNPDAAICFHGHYALLHGAALREELADFVLGGELEEQLVKILEGQSDGGDAAALSRLEIPVPSRDGLPRADRYAHLVHGEKHVAAGYTEATRGCSHLCGHCPIPAVYDGKLFVVPEHVVLDDIRQQVRAGVGHITFGDPDFLNGPAHALRVARAMHDEFPDLTFDFTAKVEHLVKHPDVVEQLRKSGAVFVVSAVESLNDRVLSILDKGHMRADVQEALRITRDVGVALRPSLLPFTPWASVADFVDILEWIETEDLIDHVDPVQFTIRLLVPPGSLLLQHPEMQAHLGEFDREHLTYRWSHPEPEMDELQETLARIVEESVSKGDEADGTFKLVRDHVDDAFGITTAAGSQPTAKAPRRRRQRPPRLTESWFC